MIYTFFLNCVKHLLLCASKFNKLTLWKFTEFCPLLWEISIYFFLIKLWPRQTFHSNSGASDYFESHYQEYRALPAASRIKLKRSTINSVVARSRINTTFYLFYPRAAPGISLTENPWRYPHSQSPFAFLYNINIAFAPSECARGYARMISTLIYV